MSESTEDQQSVGSQSAYSQSTDSQFAGKVAVITGGSQGLGAATAKLMADRGAKALVLVGRNKERGQAVVESLDCQATFVPVDLAADDAADVIIGTADERYGHVDVLVNAAGFTSRGSVWDSDAEFWDQMLKVNTRAPALLISAAAHVMKRERDKRGGEGDGGSVVNIGSVAAHGGQDFLYPYSASKQALQAVTRNAAYALMRHRIRVNLLQPGWMATEGEDVIQKRFHGADNDWLATASATQPFGRLIDPKELAQAICYLGSEESGLMTGAVIDYDQSVLGAGDAAKPDAGPVWGES